MLSHFLIHLIFLRNIRVSIDERMLTIKMSRDQDLILVYKNK